MKTGDIFLAEDDEYVTHMYKFIGLDICDKSMRKYIKLLDKTTGEVISVNFNWFKNYDITLLNDEKGLE